MKSTFGNNLIITQRGSPSKGVRYDVVLPIARPA
jgi:hypothetical protein